MCVETIFDSLNKNFHDLHVLNTSKFFSPKFYPSDGIVYIIIILDNDWRDWSKNVDQQQLKALQAHWVAHICRNIAAWLWKQIMYATWQFCVDQQVVYQLATSHEILANDNCHLLKYYNL